MTGLCRCGCGRRPRKDGSQWWPGHQRRKPGGLRVKTIRGKARRYVVERSGQLVLFSRVVMENALGRSLRPEEVVDHENGDSLDDRIENLRLYASHAEHMRDEFQRGRLTGLPLGPAASHRREATA